MANRPPGTLSDEEELPVETVKVAIVGNESVGKSQLFGRIVKNSFEPAYRPNKTVTFGVKGMQLSTHRFFWLELWDVPANPSLDTVLLDQAGEQRGRQRRHHGVHPGAEFDPIHLAVPAGVDFGERG